MPLVTCRVSAAVGMSDQTRNVLNTASGSGRRTDNAEVQTPMSLYRILLVVSDYVYVKPLVGVG